MNHPFELKIKGNEKGILPNVFITSDPHYNHKNICFNTTSWRDKKGNVPQNSTRDYKTLSAMNDAIVNGINKTVGQDDILIIAGDLAFGGAEKVVEFLDRIVCKNLYLVYGNHDQNIAKNVMNLQDYFIACYCQLHLSIGKCDFFISHYPTVSHPGLNRGVLMLHGHVHLNTQNRFGPGQQMDIGFDGSPENRPYNIITECVSLLKDRPMKSYLPNDHHTEEFTFV